MASLPPVEGTLTIENVGQYKVLICMVSNGPARWPVENDLAEDGKGALVEVCVSVTVELYCERCDSAIAALEPQTIEATDLVSVLIAHGPVCEAAPSWEGQ